MKQESTTTKSSPAQRRKGGSKVSKFARFIMVIAGFSFTAFMLTHHEAVGALWLGFVLGVAFMRVDQITK